MHVALLIAMFNPGISELDNQDRILNSPWE